MSADSQIFVRGATVEALVDVVTSVLPDVVLRHEPVDRGKSFANQRLLGDIHTHDYETTHDTKRNVDLNFSDYPLVIEFHVFRNHADYWTTQEEFGQKLFDALRQRGLESLWVWDLQTHLGSYHPAATDGSPGPEPGTWTGAGL